jgi:alkylation response protein AidB-like acyl-CoA dehydrogenase
MQFNRRLVNLAAANCEVPRQDLEKENANLLGQFFRKQDERQADMLDLLTGRQVVTVAQSTGFTSAAINAVAQFAILRRNCGIILDYGPV